MNKKFNKTKNFYRRQIGKGSSFLSLTERRMKRWKKEDINIKFISERGNYE